MRSPYFSRLFIYLLRINIAKEIFILGYVQASVMTDHY
jgi:hypothetical protein